VERYSPNRIDLNVVAGGPAFLATSEALYPGWSVAINGKPGRLYMTNGAFRGVMLSSGTNHITMTYWPEGFLVWTAISAAGLLVALVGLVWKIQVWVSDLRIFVIRIAGMRAARKWLTGLSV
jgi:hypothetical protein